MDLYLGIGQYYLSGDHVHPTRWERGKESAAPGGSKK